MEESQYSQDVLIIIKSWNASPIEKRLTARVDKNRKEGLRDSEGFNMKRGLQKTRYVNWR